MATVKKMFDINGSRTFIVAVIIVLIVGIFLRSALLQYHSPFEPDGFFDYAVLQQAVHNNFAVGYYLNLSGFPAQNPIGEPAGEYYITLAPYFLLRYFGVSLLSVMEMMPVMFGVLYIILAYPLTKMITKSRIAALLSMFFVAISDGSIIRTGATIYRGDTFAPLFLIIALLLLYRSFVDDNVKRKWLFAILAPLVLSLSVAVWNGASFAFAVYDAALLLSILFFFVKSDSEGAFSAMVASIAYIFAYFGVHIVYYGGLSTLPLPLTGASFILIYIGLILLSYLSAFANCNRKVIELLYGTWRRTAFLVLLTVLAASIMYVFFNGLISTTLRFGSPTPSYSALQTLINRTTNELQPTSFSFLMSTFAFQIFLAPFGVLLFIYLFLKEKYDRKRAYGFLIMFSFLLVTSVLQLQAIRYAALLSVPLAVFSGYLVYTGAMLSKRRTIKVSRRTRFPASSVYYGFIAALIIMCIGSSLLQYFSASSADYINAQFLSAVSWMKNNTPANSTVLTLWPDGSVVEGWGNRDSYMDSVGGENFTRLNAFALYAMNSSPDSAFLYYIHRPAYLLARYPWLYESTAIAYESGTSNVIPYAYFPMQAISSRANYYYYTSYSTSFGPSYNFSALLKYSNGIPLLNAYGFYPSSVLYYNRSSMSYSNSTTRQISPFSLLVYQNGTSASQVTGMAVVGNSLMNTNMYRLLFLCGSSCTMGNVTFSRVFSNNDSIIYSLHYR